MLVHLSIVKSVIAICSASFLGAEMNYRKPTLERNNIINKGTWIRGKEPDLMRNTNGRSFFVGTSAWDSDHNMFSNYDSFKPVGLEEVPSVNTYVERTRRAAEYLRKRHPRKSLKSKTVPNSIEDAKKIKRTVDSNTDYMITTKIGALLSRTKTITDPDMEGNQIELNTAKDQNKTENKNTVKQIPTEKDTTDKVTEKIKIEFKKPILPDKNEPKRNKKYDYEVVPEKNDTTSIERSKKYSEYFNTPDMAWHQKAHDGDLYEVVDKKPEKKMTERGLVKVITMLTKTFKKLSKQHNDIKLIHEKLINMNDDFYKRVTDLNNKFKDFDEKYANVVQLGDRMRDFEDKLTSELEFFKAKHRDMDTNILEFETQQKKFLAQQRQFYTIQKLMISQNEKINKKQNVISKTQSEISLKQNNFARILKKAKQLVIDAKNKVNTTINNFEKVDTSYRPIEVTSMPPHTTTDIVKINLFSIPIKTKLENKDALIMKEKDYQPIDELVYKYYFNNTFIDNFMKNNILNNYAATRSTLSKNKIKREKSDVTLMLPVDKKVRLKRGAMENKKNLKSNLNGHNHIGLGGKDKKDPFWIMATSFCNEIGQNKNEQILHWCVEKALRRLRFMDKKLFSQNKTTMKVKETPRGSNTVMLQHTPEVAPTKPPSILQQYPDKPSTQMYPVTSKKTADIFFPDNDALESKLEQYDLTPDTEGNVYYDGSLHLSDIVRKDHHHRTDSEATSDVMPGLMDSNSKLDVDTLAFDIQAKRRAFVRRLNENILRQYKLG